VKRIGVKPGSKLSLQKHFHRSEHWVVVKGTAEVTLGNDVRSVHENESIYIPIGSIHRLANPGKIPLELIEVEVGSYLGEDDIVRLDDVYGRWYALALPALATTAGVVTRERAACRCCLLTLYVIRRRARQGRSLGALWHSSNAVPATSAVMR
jgi:hypothetical protein